jgi:hypothetical protein
MAQRMFIFGPICPPPPYELRDRIQAEVAKIPPETCQGLIESLHRQVEAVVKAKGGPIKH